MFGLKLGFALAWSAPWCVLAVVFALSIVGIPISVVCATIGCLPVKKVVNTFYIQRYEYNNRDKPLDEECDVPWEI